MRRRWFFFFFFFDGEKEVVGYKRQASFWRTLTVEKFDPVWKFSHMCKHLWLMSVYGSHVRCWTTLVCALNEEWTLYTNSCCTETHIDIGDRTLWQLWIYVEVDEIFKTCCFWLGKAKKCALVCISVPLA